MTASDDLRARVAALLVEVKEIGDELTIVGGTAPALYRIPATVPVRPTEDIDVIVETKGLAQWHRMVHRLEAKGFRPAGGDAPVCRYQKGELVIDVMPTDDSLGFSNRWYPEAVATRLRTPFGAHVIAPLYFVATKLVAYADPDRGGDALLSIDLDDIILVLRGVPSVLDEVRDGTGEVHAFVRAQFVSIFRGADALDVVRSHLEGDAGTQALAPTLLKAILDASR